MPRSKFVAGNWKMHTTTASAKALAKVLADATMVGNVRVAVFPPFVYIPAVVDVLRDSTVGVGGQDVYPAAQGAFTGSISPAMLVDVGCRYVLVGHSERRHGLGETDEFLNRKLAASLDAGLHVIFCIGETLAERKSDQTEAVLDRQLTHGLKGFDAAQVKRLTLAYEPVWAIGTGVNATPDQAQDAHAFVRRRFGELFGADAAAQLTIQYGGSVKADNAEVLLKQPDVDGALVGGASLQADTFLPIVQAAA